MDHFEGIDRERDAQLGLYWGLTAPSTDSVLFTVGSKSRMIRGMQQYDYYFREAEKEAGAFEVYSSSVFEFALYDVFKRHYDETEPANAAWCTDAGRITSAVGFDIYGLNFYSLDSLEHILGALSPQPYFSMYLDIDPEAFYDTFAKYLRELMKRSVELDKKYGTTGDWGIVVEGP